jgi:hypothetical protein
MTSPTANEGRLRRAVVGLFDGVDAAQIAIRSLRAAGFADQDIGVVMRDLGAGSDIIRPAPGQGGEADDEAAARGAATGAATGGVVGGLLGLLGSLLLPGVGPIVAGGVLGSSLVGAGAGAATGGVIGGLIGLGVPADDARHFDRGFRAGGILLSVAADGTRAAMAARIMNQHGADLGPTGMARSRDRRVAAAPHYTGPERRSATV